MEEATGAAKLDSRVSALSEEASSLHQQLLASITQRAPANSLPEFNEGQVENKRSRDDVSTSGRLEKRSLELLEQALRKQEQLIAAFALTRGQESSREYKAAREALLLDRRSALKSIASKVYKAEQALDEVSDSYSMFKRQKHGIRGAVSLKDVIAYAHKISYSTFAPPSYVTNQELPPGFQPPAPQAEHMRASALYQFTEEELGLRAPPKTVLPEATTEEKQTGPPIPPPGWKPGMPVELPPMPPGWKPGMDLPLPPLALANLPPMPPDWKPGDPVPLPAVPAQASIPRVAEGRPQPQPIQVAHVDLDLNPDLEGGFYSSESEDEDDESDSDED